MNKLPKLIIILRTAQRLLSGAALCAALLLAGCRTTPSGDRKEMLSVSIEPQRWLLEQIVGDRMEVKTLMANGGNPETYEPTVSHLTDLGHSRAYFCVGNLGFENAILEKVTANNPDMQVFTVSDSIELIRTDHQHDGGRHAHGSVDPHTWTSAKNARIMAANMLRAMNVIDPDHSEEYADNFAALTRRLDSLDSLITATLSADSATTFIVWHPSLSYFARDYGLHQLSLGAEGREPSVADMKRLLSAAGTSGAKVFLLQRDFDRNQADALVAGLRDSVRVAEFSPLDYDFDTQLINIARAIAGTAD